MSTKKAEPSSSSKIPESRNPPGQAGRLPSRRAHIIIESDGKGGPEPSHQRPTEYLSTRRPPSPPLGTRRTDPSLGPSRYHTSKEHGTGPGGYSAAYPTASHRPQTPPEVIFNPPPGQYGANEYGTHGQGPGGYSAAYPVANHRPPTPPVMVFNPPPWQYANEHGTRGPGHHFPPPADGYTGLSPFHRNSNRKDEGIPQSTTFDDIDAGPPPNVTTQHAWFPQAAGYDMYTSPSPVPEPVFIPSVYPIQVHQPPSLGQTRPMPDTWGTYHIPTYSVPPPQVPPVPQYPRPKPSKSADADDSEVHQPFIPPFIPPSPNGSTLSEHAEKMYPAFGYQRPPVIPSRPAHMPPTPPGIISYGPGSQPVYSRPGLKPKRKLRSFALYLTRDIPKEIYIFFLLRLPALYFSRVSRIFEEADMTLGEIKKMALDSAASNTKSRAFDAVWYLPKPQQMPPAYEDLRNTWEAFIDSVMREWKTFNIISVLLLSAILTILQIDAAATDAITRYTALGSLICALMSLLYGCMYIIRFGTMRKPYKAAEWALEAQKSKTAIFWNVWVMLAMPAVWLSWSLILYICCIMAFVWRTSTHGVDRGPLSDQGLLAVRVGVTVLLGLGMLYGALVLLTFRRYGDVMDLAWKQRVKTWITPLSYASQPYYGESAPHQYYAHRPHPKEHWRTRTSGKDDVSMKGSPFVPPLVDSDEDLSGTIPPSRPSHSSNRRENQQWYRPPRRPSKATEKHTSPSSPEVAFETSDAPPTVLDNEQDVQHRQQAGTERTRRHKASDPSRATRGGIPRDTKNTTELLNPSPVSPPPPLPPPKVADPPTQPSKSTQRHSTTAIRTRGKERAKEALSDAPNEIQGVGAEKRALGVSTTRTKEGMTRVSSPPSSTRKP